MYKMVKKNIESLYKDKCDIFEYKKNNIENGITSFKEVCVIENQPCKLSFQSLECSIQSKSIDYIKQNVKLFLSNDIQINEGSKIIVTSNGISKAYKNSSPANIYTNHQEISLELFKAWT